MPLRIISGASVCGGAPSQLRLRGACGMVLVRVSLLKEAEGTWLASGCTSITVTRRIIWTRCWTGTVREATKGSAMKGFGRMKFGLTSGLLWGLDTVVLGIGLSMSLSSALPRRLRLQLSRAPLCMTSSARSGC